MHIPWSDLAENCGKILAAFALALPLGWERQKDERSVGLRTFPLVAVASCGYVLLAGKAFANNAAEHSRVLQGLMTGIGFVGGGAILKTGATVRGTATAASIWNTGAVGAAVALGFYEIAIILSLINLFVLQVFTRLEQKLFAAPDAAPGPPSGPDRPA
jgi:putative Mg2+ transporter-C (MgtC) family protein